ncbi:MAG: oligosaccharide flippase family protein [bacterium]
MSLKRNILANYISQIYVTIIGIVILPLYIKYMGAEAYGLVGFFAMLQVWFNLLDMGLTPTMARETARFRGGTTDALSYRRLVRALEGIFFVVALVGGIVMFAAAGYISVDWLQTTQLPIVEVQTAVQFMAIIIAMRWMCGLYRGIISGSERLVWLGKYNSFIATLRFVSILPVLIFIGATPAIFFRYQFGVAVLELVGLLFYAYRLLPIIPQGKRLSWSWTPLKPVFKFSLSIAFTSSVWVLITQTDKLVLSKLLSLADYGYFTLAVLVASGVMVISGPVSGAIMPHMAKLEAEGDYTGVIRVYRQATQLVAVIAGAVSITMVFCAEPLLWAWTGNKILAHQAASILVLYAIGNGILAVSAFPYYLQYAKGDLRLHLIGNIVFVVLLIPVIIWAASQYGGVGAGYVWLIMNVISFVAWLPLVHRKFAPGLNLKWYVQDILIIFLVVAIVGYGLNLILPHNDNRWWQIGIVIGFGLIVMMSGSITSTFVRKSFCMLIRGNLNGKEVG